MFQISNSEFESPIAEIGREFDKSLEWLLTGGNGE